MSTDHRINALSTLVVVSLADGTRIYVNSAGAEVGREDVQEQMSHLSRSLQSSSSYDLVSSYSPIQTNDAERIAQIGRSIFGDGSQQKKRIRHRPSTSTPLELPDVKNESNKGLLAERGKKSLTSEEVIAAVQDRGGTSLRDRSTEYSKPIKNVSDRPEFEHRPLPLIALTSLVTFSTAEGDQGDQITSNRAVQRPEVNRKAEPLRDRTEGEYRETKGGGGKPRKTIEIEVSDAGLQLAFSGHDRPGNKIDPLQGERIEVTVRRDREPSAFSATNVLRHPTEIREREVAFYKIDAELSSTKHGGVNAGEKNGKPRHHFESLAGETAAENVAHHFVGAPITTPEGKSGITVTASLNSGRSEEFRDIAPPSRRGDLKDHQGGQEGSGDQQRGDDRHQGEEETLHSFCG